MKVVNIVQTNQKGQIVIPKDCRESLGIETNSLLNLMLRGKGIYIFPVEEVITKAEVESSYAKVLEKTQGAWAEDNWDKTQRKRRKIELTASKKRKKTW